MVEIVGPGRIATITALLRGPHDARVVQATLRDHEVAPAERVDAPRDRRDDVLGARVEDRVDCVEPQPVEPEVPDPTLGRLQHPLTHRVAVTVVEVDGLAPGRLVPA